MSLKILLGRGCLVFVFILSVQNGFLLFPHPVTSSPCFISIQFVFSPFPAIFSFPILFALLLEERDNMSVVYFVCLLCEINLTHTHTNKRSIKLVNKYLVILGNFKQQALIYINFILYWTYAFRREDMAFGNMCVGPYSKFQKLFQSVNITPICSSLKQPSHLSFK